MSGRHRNASSRGSATPAHEEPQVWAEVQAVLRQIPDVHAKAQKIAQEANKHQRKMLALGPGEEPTAELLSRLQNIYQEGIRNAELEASLVAKAKEKLEIFSAIRQANESIIPAEQKRKRKDAPADIQQPVRPKKARIDEIRVGSNVAFRLPKAKQSDAEWIQCNVIRISGEPHKTRYEVQDPEPDDQGNTSQTYKATAANLILIPDDSSNLPPLAAGTMVLARYPETTTFYKAEVIATKRDGTCKLRFEGEEEIGKETDVERRLVLEA